MSLHGLDPVLLLLTPGGARERIVRCIEHANKDLGLGAFATIRMNHSHGRVAVIDNHLFTGRMGLAHTMPLLTQPQVVAMTELGITVTIVRILLAKLLS